MNPFSYLTTFANKFKEDLIITACVKMQVMKSAFEIELSVLRQIVKLSHAYLSRLFIYAINEFEGDMILLNERIFDSNKNILLWMTDGVEDKEFKNKTFNVYDFIMDTKITYKDSEFVSTHWNKPKIIK